MDFNTILGSVYQPTALKDLAAQITGSPSAFKVQESYDTMNKMTPGLPFVIALGYIVMVFGGDLIMKGTTAFNMKPLVTFWNFLLSALSIMGAIVTVPYSIQVLQGDQGISSQGFISYLCNGRPGLYDGVAGYWVFVFALSKIPEMLDTFFLVFQKKPVIFLHWYHHFTVMLFCWFAYLVGSTAGLFYASMNFTVHGLMYSYYFLMNFKAGRSLVKPLAPLITSLQIVQMVGGIVISIYCFLALQEKKDGDCKGLNTLNVQLGTAMYVSYFILFALLFKKMYISKGSKGSKKGGAPTSREGASVGRVSPKSRKE